MFLRGGVLIPALFKITIVDLAKRLPKSMRLFLYADDICVRTSSIAQRYVSARLQTAANTILDYLEKRCLIISPGKFAAMEFTRKKMTKYSILIMGKPIAFVKQHIILGVSLGRSLTWFPHVRRLKKIYINIR